MMRSELYFAAICQTNQVCTQTLPKVAANGSFIQTVIQIVVAVVAALSLLFIAIGGLRYILSQGDPSGVTKAKSTIVYALVGLVVAIFAQFIVIFVVNKVAI